MDFIRFGRRFVRYLALGGVGLLAVGPLHAEENFWADRSLAALTPEQREQLRDQVRQQWQNSSPEDRQRLRDEFRERRESMSPEQRQQFREQARERWQQMNPEQRQELRQRFEERRQEREGGRPGGEGEGRPRRFDRPEDGGPSGGNRPRRF